MAASANAKSKGSAWLWQNLDAPSEQAGDRVPDEVLEGTTPPEAPPNPPEPGVDALTGLALAQTKANSDLSTALGATSKTTPVIPSRPEKGSANAGKGTPATPEAPVLPAVAAEQAKQAVAKNAEVEELVTVTASAVASTEPSPPENWDSILESWHRLLQKWSLDGSLEAAAREALMLDGTPDELKTLIDQWSVRDFRSLPEIVFLSNEDMNGAMGAYAISTGKIYINANWANQALPEQIHAVLTEEQGHHLDGVLNSVDTIGDEGDYFAKLLLNSHSTAEAVKQGNDDNDAGSILIEGVITLVENAHDIKDYAPPVLEDIILSFNQEKRCFNISLAATDDLSGVVFAGAGIESEINPQTYQQISLAYDSIKKRWEGEFQLGNEAPDGKYILRRVYLLDGVGNTVNYGNNWGEPLSEVLTSGELINPNPPTNADSTPPEIKSLDLKFNDLLNRFELVAAVTDGGSGVESVHARLIAESAQSNCHQITLIKDTDGLWRGHLQLDSFSPSGNWLCNRILAFDASKNLQNYGDNWSTVPVNIPTTGVLYNPGSPLSDPTPPTVTSVKYLCNLGLGTFKIIAEIEESGSGVGFAQAWIRSEESPDNRQIINLELQPDGTWVGIYNLQPLSPDGSWRLERLMVNDNANNFRDYPESEIPLSLSFDTIKFKGILHGHPTLNSFLTGDFGDDILTGAAGLDTMNGKDGGDIYVITTSADHNSAEIKDTGTIGIDELRFSSVTAGQTLTLFAGDTGIERVAIGTGTAATTDTTSTTTLNINASAAVNPLTITGNNGANSLTGTAFDDTIIGNDGNDTIIGGGGKDILTGGLGADIFRFASILNASTNVDKIIDFSVAQKDKIQLENTGTGLFTAITKTGTLATTAFISGTAFTTKSQRIRYESSTGNLFYDADGSGSASASILFATLSTGLAMTNSQFIVT